MAEIERLESLLRAGKINRRQFLNGLAALGISMAIVPDLFTRGAEAATIKKGGRLRLGMAGGSITDSLDPAKIVDTVMQSVNLQLRNCLIELNYKSEIVPELAETWESSPDASEWTFKLRKGVEFHNGKTLDSKDVVYTFNYHRGPDSKSAAKSIISQIKNIKAIDKETVEMTLESGNADFPFIMSDYHLAIVPDGTTDFEKGMGTGGYVLESFEPGVRVLTKRNPNYWKKDRAHFDEVETIYIADVTARTTALKTGVVDAINRCDFKTLSMLKKDSNLQIIRTTGTRHYTFPMLTDIAPYNNNDARLALKHAIDRESLVKIVLGGYGTVGNDHPISPTMRYFASDLPQRKFDPDKAKFYLKQAGLEGHSFKLHAADAAFGGGIDAAVLYKENAAKAGINIEVVKEPDDGYWKSVWMKKPWCESFWSGRPTEDWMFSLTYAADAKWNDTHWNSERFNKLLLEARTEFNETKRREMYAEMQKIVRDDGGVVIPMFADTVAAANKNVRFTNVAPHFELDGIRCAERWWKA